MARLVYREGNVNWCHGKGHVLLVCGELSQGILKVKVGQLWNVSPFGVDGLQVEWDQ
jgi:hypothetical protein